MKKVWQGPDIIQSGRKKNKKRWGHRGFGTGIM